MGRSLRGLPVRYQSMRYPCRPDWSGREWRSVLAPCPVHAAWTVSTMHRFTDGGLPQDKGSVSVATRSGSGCTARQCEPTTPGPARMRVECGALSTAGTVVAALRCIRTDRMVGSEPDVHMPPGCVNGHASRTYHAIRPCDRDFTELNSGRTKKGTCLPNLA